MENLKDKLSTVRVRTWSLTASIIVAIVLYMFVQVTWQTEINIIDFILLACIQVTTHIIYFPDGEISGGKDNVYIGNKTAYNTKATAINENKQVRELRDYCDYEYELRRSEYIKNECGAIGIDLTELEKLRELPITEIKKLTQIELDGKLFFFDKHKRKRLIKLLHGTLPIERNNAETILSAIEQDYGKAIRDNSIRYKAKSHIRKIILAFGVGLFLAYIGYTSREFGLYEITRAFICLVSMFTNAVTSYTQGETCIKVHKNNYYLQLSNFIDGFNAWLPN